MSYTKLTSVIYVKDQTAYADRTLKVPVSKDLSAADVCVRMYHNGIDAIVYYDLSYDDASHETAINDLRAICKETDIPVYATGNIRRVEDVKKYLYAGCAMALLEESKESNMAMKEETVNRFGTEKVGVITGSGDSTKIFSDEKEQEIILIEADADYDYMMRKNELRARGVNVNTFESAIPFSEFKLNGDGLIPVVVQDYETDEVLMLAYMNEESYNLTLKTGRMTYYSRSRSELWEKGLTSGHFQYVMSLKLDCDNDTILAKVRQVGAACHTGAHSCFFKKLADKETNKVNPLKVFNDVMDVIKDRKIHPKEGSYTNYLFDKGIDKILKKVGEEATEIVIAAKNPDPVEVKYEISDFLYHVMVLMVEKGLDWEEITEELANR
ncbi:MAG: bifunctional phosphoribosyl-AMP cyclohydrolase/phosphoribosyl-ATP diphosphatase HisIE [Butyrivibrio sp.]